jgi:hypothetical protein
VITDLLLVLLVVLLNLLKFSHTIMFISFQQENGVMWKTYKIVFNIHYRTQSQCGGIFSQWEAVTYCCCCCLCGVYLFHLIYTTPYSVLCAWFCNKIIELITLKLKFLETSIGKVNLFKSRVVNFFFVVGQWHCQGPYSIDSGQVCFFFAIALWVSYLGLGRYSIV